jgi:hypothetical protein
MTSALISVKPTKMAVNPKTVRHERTARMQTPYGEDANVTVSYNARTKAIVPLEPIPSVENYQDRRKRWRWLSGDAGTRGARALRPLLPRARLLLHACAPKALVIARVDGIARVQTVLPYTAMALARPTLL